MRKATSLLLFVFCAIPAFAREEQTRDFRKTVALPAGRTFRIEHSLGNINIRTHANNEAAIAATIKCQADSLDEARTCVEAIKIEVTETAAGVSVRTSYPEQFGRGRRNLGFSASYDIVIPESAPLDVRNRFGSSTVAGARGGATINNSHGALRFTDGRGTVRLEDAFGSVEAARIQGDLTVVDQNGSVSVTDVSGAVDVRDRFGRVDVTRAGGAVTVDSGNGQVEVDGAGGVVRVNNSFGAVRVTGAKADVIVTNGNGPVDVRNATGLAELRTSFGSVRFSGIGKDVSVRAGNSTVTGDSAGGSVVVETNFGGVDLRDIKGGARVTAGNSPITLTGIGGEVYAKSSFGGVTVNGAGGPITVENNNGAISVAAKPAKGCQAISLRTSFGPMRVAVPDGAAYDVTAHTSFGKITSEHELAVSGAVGGDSLKGRIGAGGCQMMLNNANGSIQILKSLRTTGNI